MSREAQEVRLSERSEAGNRCHQEGEGTLLLAWLGYEGDKRFCEWLGASELENLEVTDGFLERYQ